MGLLALTILSLLVLCPLYLSQLAPLPGIRIPAVPLIVHDPYFSIWSTADSLTSEWTVHWTGKVQAIFSLLRVDGVAYRVIGPACVSATTVSPLLQAGFPQVYPVRTLYTYSGAGIQLNLTFITPKFANDLDSFKPVTYVEYALSSIDGANHSVQIYFDVTGQLAVDTDDEEVESFRNTVGDDMTDMRIGTKTPQPVLKKSGDDVRIDWGYAHLAFGNQGPGGVDMLSWLGNAVEARNMFASSGLLPTEDQPAKGQPACTNMEGKNVCDCNIKTDWPALVAATSEFTVGPTKADGSASASQYFILAYDDSPGSIGYFGAVLQAYWRRNGAKIEDVISDARSNYILYSLRAFEFDQVLVSNLISVGGINYATMASLAYRQTLGANKLVWYDDALKTKKSPQPFLFVKGCFSSGDTGTIDDNFPAAPLYLYFNPDLIPAFLAPILMFANNETYAGDTAPFPRNVSWTESYSPHFLGFYPNAELQCMTEKVMCEPMPVEMTGDILLLLAAVAIDNNDTTFIEEYFQLLTRFADYLVENGLDPVKQLTTDDFEGPLAHNVNLAAKAIIAIAAFARMCEIGGYQPCHQKYLAVAKNYSSIWMKKADDGDHYRLAYDQDGTWSLKFNLFWDKLLKTNVFPEEVFDKEINEYQRHLKQYGWPLDNRNSWANLGWNGWVNALTNQSVHYELLNHLVNWIQQTPQRVPMTDFYDAENGTQYHFQARAQVGALYAKLLLEMPLED
eukprot:m.308983 g.308983  ORF g.308983 m.308983 type:complete len:735 (+) comp45228_c0_seq1:771-2975(+)